MRLVFKKNIVLLPCLLLIFITGCSKTDEEIAFFGIVVDKTHINKIQSDYSDIHCDSDLVMPNYQNCSIESMGEGLFSTTATILVNDKGIITKVDFIGKTVYSEDEWASQLNKNFGDPTIDKSKTALVKKWTGINGSARLFSNDSGKAILSLDGLSFIADWENQRKIIEKNKESLVTDINLEDYGWSKVQDDFTKQIGYIKSPPKASKLGSSCSGVPIFEVAGASGQGTKNGPYELRIMLLLYVLDKPIRATNFSWSAPDGNISKSVSCKSVMFDDIDSFNMHCESESLNQNDAASLAATDYIRLTVPGAPNIDIRSDDANCKNLFANIVTLSEEYAKASQK